MGYSWLGVFAPRCPPNTTGPPFSHVRALQLPTPRGPTMTDHSCVDPIEGGRHSPHTPTVGLLLQSEEYRT